MSFDIMREPRRSSSRRGFLRLAGGAAGGIGIASAAQALDAGDPLAVPEWSRTPGAPSASPPYGRPSPYEVLGRKSRTPPTFPGAASTGTPLQHLQGIITPNGLHFERHHAGVPAIDPERHRLAIHGLVERPLVLTMDDLVRIAPRSRASTSSNARAIRPGSAPNRPGPSRTVTGSSPAPNGPGSNWRLSSTRSA